MMNSISHIVTFLSYIKHPKKRTLLRICQNLENKIGLEIGGPSSFFHLKSYFPIYAFAKRIDGLNFSTHTLWEGKLQEGQNYCYFQNKVGYQYISEATYLSEIPDNSYDFLLSCHSLEHIANPIKALKEWVRVLKNGGLLVLILPNKYFTFDINRPYTKFNHLVDDYYSNIDEHDKTHFDEILEFHDLERDKGLSSKSELKNRLQNNFLNRCAHHHVFNLEVIHKMIEFSGMCFKHQQIIFSSHLMTIAEKRESLNLTGLFVDFEQ